MSLLTDHARRAIAMNGVIDGHLALDLIGRVDELEAAHSQLNVDHQNEREDHGHALALAQLRATQQRATAAENALYTAESLLVYLAEHGLNADHTPAIRAGEEDLLLYLKNLDKSLRATATHTLARIGTCHASPGYCNQRHGGHACSLRPHTDNLHGCTCYLKWTTHE